MFTFLSGSNFRSNRRWNLLYRTTRIKFWRKKPKFLLMACTRTFLVRKTSEVFTKYIPLVSIGSFTNNTTYQCTWNSYVKIVYRPLHNATSSVVCCGFDVVRYLTQLLQYRIKWTPNVWEPFIFKVRNQTRIVREPTKYERRKRGLTNTKKTPYFRKYDEHDGTGNTVKDAYSRQQCQTRQQRTPFLITGNTFACEVH